MFIRASDIYLPIHSPVNPTDRHIVRCSDMDLRTPRIATGSPHRSFRVRHTTKPCRCMNLKRQAPYVIVMVPA